MNTRACRITVLAVVATSVPCISFAQSSIASVVLFDLRKPEPTSVTVTEDSHNVTAYPARLVNAGLINDCQSVQMPRPNPGTKPELSADTTYNLSHLIALIRCASSATPVAAQGTVSSNDIRAALIAAVWIDTLLARNPKRSDFRARSSKGDSIRIVALQAAAVYRDAARYPLLVRGQVPNLTIKEAGREARIGSDAHTLARLVFAIAAPPATDRAAAAREDDIRAKAPKTTVKRESWISVSDYVLKVSRSNLKVDAKPDKAGSAV